MKRRLLVVFAWLAVSAAAFAEINLNTATRDQLDSLKGVGPAKAQAIVDYRSKNGPFKSVDELDNVPGFGKATVDGLRSQVTIGGSDRRPPANVLVAPKVPVGPTEAPKALAPATPAKAAEPAKPALPAPAKPIAPVKAVEPASPALPTPAKPAAPVKAPETPKVVPTATPVKAVEPAKPAMPAPAKPGAAKPAGPVQPSQESDPAVTRK